MTLFRYAEQRNDFCKIFGRGESRERGGNIQTDFFGEPVDATHLSRSELSRGVALDDRRWPAPIRHGLVLSSTKMHTIWSEHTATESTCSLSKYVLISVLKLPFPRLERVRQQFHRMLFVKLCIEAGVESVRTRQRHIGTLARAHVQKKARACPKAPAIHCPHTSTIQSFGWP